MPLRLSLVFTVLTMVYCNICHINGPWTVGRSLSRHQVPCRRKSQELAVARAAEEAAQLNGLPLDIPNDVCTILFSGVAVSLILHNPWQFMQVDPIEEVSTYSHCSSPSY